MTVSFEASIEPKFVHHKWHWTTRGKTITQAMLQKENIWAVRVYKKKKKKNILGDVWTIWPIHAAHALPAAQGFRRSAECSLHYNTTLFSNETLLVCLQTLLCGLSEEHSSKSPSELANWNQCVSISYTALHTCQTSTTLAKKPFEMLVWSWTLNRSWGKKQRWTGKGREDLTQLENKPYRKIQSMP